MLNGYFYFVLVTVLGFYLLDFVSNLLNLGALRPDLPHEFQDVFDAEKYRESQAYTRATTRYEMVASTILLLIFFAFWWCGGFGWLDRLVQGWNLPTIANGLAFIGLLYLGSWLIQLPFSIYDTFVLEESFGFNKTTAGTFISDRLKTLALTVAVGGPLVAVIIYLFEMFGSRAWLYGWILVAVFTLIMSYLAPQIILPLFHKLKPLAPGSLKTAIEQMSQKCKFPLTEVFEIDGSRRSTKSNAFFTGFGKNKKIALFDTLIENHTEDELVAVLAHEIGHYKKKHILQMMVIGILQMGVLFFLLGFFMKNQGLHQAFGVTQVSVYCSLVLFFFLYEPISKLLGIGMMLFSRKNEFEADAYAAAVTERADSLISGLKKLSKDNLSNLTPHPFYVFLNYSHPPVLQRITALRGGSGM